MKTYVLYALVPSTCWFGRSPRRTPPRQIRPAAPRIFCGEIFIRALGTVASTARLPDSFRSLMLCTHFLRKGHVHLLREGAPPKTSVSCCIVLLPHSARAGPVRRSAVHPGRPNSAR